MIVDRYTPVDLSGLIPELSIEMEPELRELDRLLSDDALFALVGGVDCSVWLSHTAAVGCGRRPSATRSSARRSWTSASKHPAASQRRARWYATGEGGRSWGIRRHWPPVLTM
jgi:hypothetical protein